MVHSGVMSEHRERMGIPASWVIVAAAAVVTLGWVFFVATGPVITAAASIPVAVILSFLLVRTARVLIVTDETGVSVGDAHLPRAWIGSVTDLRGKEWQDSLRAAGGGGSWLRIRNHRDGGVVVENTDPDDPITRWFISSGDPATFAAAIRQTGHDNDRTSGRTHHGL